MDYVLFSDVLRYLVGVTCLWLSFALAVAGWRRARRYGFREGPGPNPLSSWAVSLGLALTLARRYETLGEPGDTYLYGSVVLVGLLLAGFLLSNQVRVVPPTGMHLLSILHRYRNRKRHD